jgi:DNA-binding transcriptional MerR regulator
MLLDIGGEPMIENRRFDEEWVKLITEARDLGVSKEDIRLFLQTTIEKKKVNYEAEPYNVK